MNTFTFDEKALVDELQRLRPALRVAFAAACAERQMAAYWPFANRHYGTACEALGHALEDAWLKPAKTGDTELQQQLETCMALIPQEDTVQTWTEDATYAQDAGISVVYTLRTRISGKSQEAAWSARHAYESLDHYLINRYNIDTNLPDGELKVLLHPLVQVELARQLRDLSELLADSGENLQQLIGKLRDRAKSESGIFFDLKL